MYINVSDIFLSSEYTQNSLVYFEDGSELN